MTLFWKQGLILAVLSALVILTVYTVKIKTDLANFFVTTGNTEQALLASEMQSGALSKRYLVSLRAVDGLAQSTELVADLIGQFRSVDGVSEVWQPGSERVAIAEIAQLYARHSAQLYPPSVDLALDSMFTEAGLQQRAVLLKKALLSPQASVVKVIAKHDPLLLTFDTFQSLAPQFESQVQSTNLYHNLVIETTVAGLNVPEQRLIQQRLKKKVSTLNDQYKTKLILEMTGVPIFAVATQSLIENDVKRLTIVSSIAITCVFFLLFRSFTALFWVFALLTTVVITSVLVTHAVFGFIHGMTLAIGTTLIGVCIDYPIHALVHFHETPLKQRHISVVKIWPSMLMGGMTTIVGYVALGFSGYPGFKQIAVYASTGILVSLLITRYALPKVLTGNNRQNIFLPGLQQWVRFCLRFKKILWLLIALLLIVAISGVTKLNWMKDLQQLTPEMDYLKVQDQAIRSRMVSIEPGRFVLVKGDDVEGTLQKAEHVYSALDTLQTKNKLEHYFGLGPWLLSEQKQAINQRRLVSFINPQHRALWQTALAEQGLSVKSLGELNYQQQTPLTLQDVFANPVKHLIDSQIIVDKQQNQTLLMIWLGEHDPAAVARVVAKLPDVEYFSQRDMLNSMALHYSERALTMLWLGLGFILLLLLLRYRSLFAACITLMPAVISAVIILGGWSLTQQSVSFLHLIGFLLAVAICVDYGIFFRENGGGNIQRTYQAIAASMLTSTTAFGCLIFAETTLLRMLAIIVAMGVVIGFLLCPMIIKPIR